MPDEITPEQWRAWSENPCTKRLVAKLEGEALAFDETAASARAAALQELDGGGSNLRGEHCRYREARRDAGTMRMWAGAVRKMIEPAPAPDEPRRVTVQG